MFSKSIFASKTFLTFMASIVGVWTAYFQGQMDQQAAITATIAAVVAIGLRLITVGPVHVVTPTVATQATPTSPVVKTATQAGYARPALLVAIMVLSACAALGLQPQTLDQSLLEAESTATSALSASTALLSAGTITLQADQKIRNSHDLVIASVKTARAFEQSGNAAAAASQLAALQGDLAFLKTIK